MNKMLDPGDRDSILPGSSLTHDGDGQNLPSPPPIRRGTLRG